MINTNSPLHTMFSQWLQKLEIPCLVDASYFGNRTILFLNSSFLSQPPASINAFISFRQYFAKTLSKATGFSRIFRGLDGIDLVATSIIYPRERNWPSFKKKTATSSLSRKSCTLSTEQMDRDKIADYRPQPPNKGNLTRVAKRYSNEYHHTHIT